MPYTRINWEDLPSTNTPLNATNLNKMDEELEKLSCHNVATTGQDLNDYKTRGLYWFGSTNPANRPANIDGWLEVIEYNNRYVRQIWHRSSSINGTAEFETYIRFTNDYGTNWSSWDKIVMRNELDELNISSDSVSGGSTWSKTLTNGTYLIVLTRTNGGTSAGLYVANINSTSFLTTVNAYYAGGAELTLSGKVVSITPNAAMTATVIKLTGR